MANSAKVKINILKFFTKLQNMQSLPADFSTVAA